MRRLHLVRSAARPRPDERSAQVVDLRARREAKQHEPRPPQPPKAA